MLPFAQRLASASALLAAYAVPHAHGLGRTHAEDDDETRFRFQRDRDRILHTQAFRRLMHKTQVFVTGTGDHYRTRITHTLEVAQVSRDMARTLSLNEDLAECIALAHDLGHTPFGHAGEEALSSCMEPYGKRFEHNLQSLRTVTLLEHRSTQYHGLNLSVEVLEGLMKHRTPHDLPEDMHIERSPSLEAQVVNLADEIAYTAHDIDDGLRAGVFTLKDVSTLALGKQAVDLAAAAGTEVRGCIVHVLVSDVYAHTTAVLLQKQINTLAKVYTAQDALVSFSPVMREKLAGLRQFLWDRLYMHPDVLRQANRGKDIIRSLFARYISVAPAKVLALQKKHGGALDEAVKDYIAGMTDVFAVQQLQ